MFVFCKPAVNHPYALAMAVNADYLPYALVTYASLLEHCSVPTHLYILHCGLTAQQLKPFITLSQKISDTKGLKHQFSDIFINKSKVDLPISIHYISIETYLRFFIPEFIPHEQCLYIDADILVNRDIAPLLKTKLRDHLLGGVQDLWVATDSAIKNYISSLKKPELLQLYVNAGVLLFNNKQMKVSKTQFKLLETATTNKLKYQDQDALNLVCAGSILSLPKRYNFCTYNINSSNKFFKKLIKKFPPCILHFTGPDKPWNTPYHPFRKVYTRKANDLYALLKNEMPESYIDKLNISL